MANLACVVLIAPTLVRPPQRAGRRLLRALARVLAGWRPSRRLLGLGLALLAAGALVAGYSATATPVLLVVDGHARTLRTHQDSVAGLLREADLALRPEDVLVPDPDAGLAAGSVVQVRLALPVVVDADGRSRQLYTQHPRVADILAEAGVRVNPRDQVLLNGQVWDIQAGLPRPGQAGESEPAGRAAPARLVLRRAVPVRLSDDGVPVTFYSTEATVGEALLSQGILLYLGDRVTPSLGSRLLPGMRIYIQRSTPVTLRADGRTLRTRTQRELVGDVLAQEGIALMGRDYSLPPLDSPVTADMAVRVVRVHETLEIEHEFLPFETRWVPDPDMRIDTQQIVQAGGEGVIKRRYRATYEDGQEVSNVLEDEWLDRSPEDKIIAYGTQILVQTLDTPEGPFEYWRHFRVLATSYSAATSGKAADDPHYGITRTGLPAGYGIIAVDPKVIPLWAEVYVPGYGRAVAGDTGGSILGRHVDLGFNEDVPPLWYHWVDIYLATPLPPENQIRYVLPNWPQEPGR